MANIVNPHQMSWVNPTTATAANGNTVAWSANNDLAGIEIYFDGVAAVDVPVSFGTTSMSLLNVAAYEALAIGSHTVGIAVVTSEGSVGQESNIVTFLIDLIPSAPTNLALA